MLQTDSYRTRKQKLNYLNGLLEGSCRIHEIMESRAYLFRETEIEGVFYKADNETFRLIEGDERRYTLEEVEKIRRRPNARVVVIRGARKPHVSPI